LKEPGRQISSDEFVALLVRHERRLRAFVATLLGRFEDIDEVVQNAWLVAWRKMDTFSCQSESPDEEFLRWLCAIARLELLAYRRKRGPGLVLFDEELIENLADMRIEQADYFESRHHALVNCLQRLSPRDREMIFDRYGRGKSVQILATSAGRSLDGIYKSLGRIRSALFSCIDLSLKQEGCQ
jgi:RNA polymerase sigma-70 factor, ECF subfamily